MNNQYEVAANAVKNAEKALEMLNEFVEPQRKAKGETMREQIANYIAEVLADAGYICGNNVHVLGYIRLAWSPDHFTFYVKSSANPYLDSMTPVFTGYTNGNIYYINPLNEAMMMYIVRNWETFKKELHESIKNALEKKTKQINQEIAHIAYVNEQLEKWHV